MSTDDHRGRSPSALAATRPPGLIAATVVLALEALALVGFAAWMIVRHGSDVPSNEQVYSGSVVYLVVFGAMIAIVAASLWRLRGWAYGAAVFFQILALPIAWMMAGEQFWVGAVPLATAAIVAVGGLMTAPSRQVLGRNRWDESGSGDSRES